MRFRTEIDIRPEKPGITHSDRVVMLGSCFTDEIGQRMADDGFNVLANPLGPLYNPVTIGRTLMRSKPYEASDLVEHEGRLHCLDFASRYSGTDAGSVLDAVNSDFMPLQRALREASVVILTLGTAWVFDYVANGTVAGNCHKLPDSMFSRRRLSVDQCVDALAPAIAGLPRVVLTVSPIRHLADGLQGNSLSKATLLLAAERLCTTLPRCTYFPSYEIMLDDLRDYRFYASDMKHPSAVAVDYIYEKWGLTYFSPETQRIAAECHARSLRAAHRPIITDKP